MEFETNCGHLEPEEQSQKTDPPEPNQADDGWNKSASAYDRGTKADNTGPYEHANLMSLPYPKHMEAELISFLAKYQEPGANVSHGKVRTPIVWASINGEVTFTKMLVSSGADLEELDDKRKTPLYHAVENGHWPVVTLLLEKGANVEGGMPDCSTPLMCAAWWGHKSIVKLLLDSGANIEPKSSKGDRKPYTPLTCAVFQRHDAIVKLLLDRGANIEGRRGNSWPLAAAIQICQESVIKLLLHRGANIEAKDDAGDTPLTNAAKLCRGNMVKILLDSDTNIEANDSQGKTALVIATSMGLTGIREMLLRRGAKKSMGYYSARLSSVAK